MEEWARNEERAHKGLLALLEQSQAALAAGDINRALARLRGVVEAHFAAEESPGGLIAAALARAPHRSDQLEELVIEHRSLAAAIARLTEQARDANEEAVRSISRELTDFCTAMRAHEAREADILAEIAYTEVSAQD